MVAKPESQSLTGWDPGLDIISYPLFADADTGIYPHAASQYHARPKAKRGIAMLSVDKFPYPRKQTRGNEFIPCSNNIDADTGIYPHAASQYHARPKAKRGIAMLSVDKFPYPRKQTRGNEFIPCSNNICDILKRFRSFKIPAITLIWPKSSYKHSVTRSCRSGKESGRLSESPLWRHQWRSFVFISHADDVKREIRLHISRLLTNQKRESARNMG